jgi:hypothetical protein
LNESTNDLVNGLNNKDNIFKKNQMITYISNSKGNFLYFPDSINIPYEIQQLPKEYPGNRPKCEAPGCTNERLYSCKKTNLSLCSLDCYKKIHS